MPSISCQGPLPFWLLFRTLSARVPFYDPCVVSASILAPFRLHFGVEILPFDALVRKAPAYHRKDPLRKNSSFKGHLGIIVLEQPQKNADTSYISRINPPPHSVRRGVTKLSSLRLAIAFCVASRSRHAWHGMAWLGLPSHGFAEHVTY